MSDVVVERIDRDGVPWFAAPLPRRWHACRTQSLALLAGRSVAVVERCACGALRRDGIHWTRKNERRKKR